MLKQRLFQDHARNKDNLKLFVKSIESVLRLNILVGSLKKLHLTLDSVVGIQVTLNSSKVGS